jgi:tetratricopeptide (TPR) repeat protein
MAWVPYVCNITIRTVEARTGELFKARMPDFQRAAAARENHRLLSTCDDCIGDNANVHLLAASNWSVRGDNEMAVREYTDALRYDRRPELYFNLGMAQLDREHFDDAVRSLETAGFVQFSSIDDIPPGTIHDEVYRRVMAVYGPLGEQAKQKRQQ